jgi:hypothetical protein
MGGLRELHRFFRIFPVQQGVIVDGGVHDRGHVHNGGEVAPTDDLEQLGIGDVRLQTSRLSAISGAAVDTYDLDTSAVELVDQVATDEPRSTRYQDRFQTRNLQIDSAKVLVRRRDFNCWLVRYHHGTVLIDHEQPQLLEAA